MGCFKNLAFTVLIILILTIQHFRGENIVRNFTENACTSKSITIEKDGTTKYKLVYKCCLNYQFVNGICEECPLGTFGSGGKCDQYCPDGHYGRFCAKTCECMKNERCDKAVGCTCFQNCTQPIGTTEHFNESDYIARNTTSEKPSKNLCLQISIILCCTIFSFTMLTISTSYLSLWDW